MNLTNRKPDSIVEQFEHVNNRKISKINQIQCIHLLLNKTLRFGNDHALYSRTICQIFHPEPINRADISVFDFLHIFL